jgi:hypothetical protein
MAAPWDRGKWVRGVAHWRDGKTAFISVAFTWRLPEARKIAEYYRAVGCATVRCGGPGTFTRKAYVSEFADVGGVIPDALRRHNPNATRASYGCPVGCWFCIVPKMDGKAFSFIPDFPVRPVLCDDNLSALPAKYQDHIVARYIAAGVPLLDANSGFEPATFDEEVFTRWSPILKGPWRFGYDEATEGEAVGRVFKMLEDLSPRKKQVYTMIGHEPFDICMDRIRKVIALGGEPYAQPFLKLNALEKKPAIRHDWTMQKLQDVSRWVNRHLWRNVPFEDYIASTRSPRQKDNVPLFCEA